MRFVNQMEETKVRRLKAYFFTVWAEENGFTTEETAEEWELIEQSKVDDLPTELFDMVSITVGKQDIIK